LNIRFCVLGAAAVFVFDAHVEGRFGVLQVLRRATVVRERFEDRAVARDRFVVAAVVLVEDAEVDERVRVLRLVLRRGFIERESAIFVADEVAEVRLTEERREVRRVALERGVVAGRRVFARAVGFGDAAFVVEDVRAFLEGVRAVLHGVRQRGEVFGVEERVHPQTPHAEIGLHLVEARKALHREVGTAHRARRAFLHFGAQAAFRQHEFDRLPGGARLLQEVEREVVLTEHPARDARVAGIGRAVAERREVLVEGAAGGAVGENRVLGREEGVDGGRLLGREVPNVDRGAAGRGRGS
jgi:hypothetical protein